MGDEGGLQGHGALRGERRGIPVVHGGGRHQADADVTVVVVVPAEELLAVHASVLD